MPLTKLQSHALRILAADRSPDSYIAGDAALNRDGPRFSNDIDIFQDSEDRMATVADHNVLATAQPIDPAALHRQIRAMLEDAEARQLTLGVAVLCVRKESVRGSVRGRISPGCCPNARLLNF